MFSRTSFNSAYQKRILKKNMFWDPQIKFCTNFWVKHRSVKKVISLNLLEKLPTLPQYISALFFCYVQTFADSTQPDCKGCS